jgi:hypothetical protein
MRKNCLNDPSLGEGVERLFRLRLEVAFGFFFFFSFNVEVPNHMQFDLAQESKKEPISHQAAPHPPEQAKTDL